MDKLYCNFSRTLKKWEKQQAGPPASLCTSLVFFNITLFKVSLISLWPVYRMLPLVNGTFCACLTCSVLGAARRVLTGCSSDSFPVSLLALALSLDDALDPRRNPPRSRVARGELGRASACSILSALEERSRLENKFYTPVSYGVHCCVTNTPVIVLKRTHIICM